jgi:uncharacterized membrane protein YbaN (DUF454 family)
MADTGGVRTGPARWAWLVAGWLAAAVGAAGVIVPGLPTTGPFVLAASCFAKSSPRFERWVLSLPRIGPLVRDHRAGLGMPRRAKVMAVSMIVVAVSASTLLAIPSPVAKSITVAAGVVGCWYVGLRIPTRERVLAARGDGGGGPGDQPAHPSSATNTSRISAEGLTSGSDDGRR